MTVVTLPTFTPPARGDHKPWKTATIEEAATSTGTWAAIDTIALAPADVDPEAPAPRTLTTELGTLDPGWYRVTLTDADGNTVILTPVAWPDAPWKPTVAEVAARMFARTRDKDTNEVGTFNADTVPTGDQAATLIDDAYTVVVGELGPRIDSALHDLAKYAVIARTAMSIERGFYPEEANAADATYGPSSAYKAWADEYAATLVTLRASASQDQAGQARVTSRPMRTLVTPSAGGRLDPWNTGLLP